MNTVLNMTHDEINRAELKRRARDKDGYEFEMITGASDHGIHKPGPERAIVTQHPLDMMKKRRIINDRQYNAGIILMTLCDTASKSMSAMGYDGRSIDAIAYGPRGLPERVQEACQQLHGITRHLVHHVRWPLINVCWGGHSLATAYAVNPKRRPEFLEARGKFILSLDMLADLV